jgi:hypothetical protein
MFLIQSAMSGYFGNGNNLANHGGYVGHGGDGRMCETDRAGMITVDWSTIVTNYEGRLDLKTFFKYVMDNISPLFPGAAN